MTRLLSRALSGWLIVVCAAFAGACTSGNGDDGEDVIPTATTRNFPAGSTMAAIIERGKIVVGVKFDVPLFGLLDPVSRKVDGFDVALAREIAKELGLREDQLELVETISANRIPYLQDDKVDIVVSTMTINAQRKEQIEFSRPYYLAGQSILVRKETTNINSINDLRGKRVCSALGSTSELNVRERVPQAELVSLQTYSACVLAMKEGRVDAVSTDDIILAGYAASDSSLKLVGGLFTTEAYGVGIKKGQTDMALFVTEVLNRVVADGRWEELYNQYLGNVGGLPPAAEAKSKLPAE